MKKNILCFVFLGMMLTGCSTEDVKATTDTQEEKQEAKEAEEQEAKEAEEQAAAEQAAAEQAAAEQAAAEQAEAEQAAAEQAAAEQAAAEQAAAEQAAAEQAAAAASNVYYENCTDVRNHGAAPLYVGDPGWQDKFDRDGDGVACEV